MISVLTPTIRKEGLDIVKKALDRQTFEDFEWLVGSPFNPISGSKWVKDDFSGGFWTLNRIYNKLIKEAKGELIVSWQDFTFADADALEKFYFHFKNEPKTLITGVGNKYDKVYPELGTLLWKDPRETDKNGTFYPCYPQDIEWNFSSCSKQALIDIGGFDEELDFIGFGLDAYQVNQRLWDLGGYDFKIDQTLKSYSLTHGRVDNWDKDNVVGEKYDKHMLDLKARGKWPVLNFL